MRRASRRSSAGETPPTYESPYSASGEARRDALFEIIDELPLWQVQLIWEYGVDRVLRCVKEHPTPSRAAAALEADRLRNEAVRWLCGGTLPVGY
ncbi:MAG: hypothetical protein E6Q97_11260 [Desulfurellales bacterium]|nr:MAG: hypothetical protein E6Q97_11260 [Desulfurellales bacterium]